MTEKKINIIESLSLNPYFNIAYEEYLLRNLKQNEIIFFLYCNSTCVVIGKHQNPWNECRVEECSNNNIKILRRLTGGGAVYHDNGNLNFSFIAVKDLFNKEKQFMVILNALKELKLSIKINKFNDILIDNKKISGSAFFYNKKAGIHHGTLLVNAGINNISYYLSPDIHYIDKVSIPSRKSIVANISNYSTAANINNTKQKLISSFCTNYNIKIEPVKINEYNMPYSMLNLYQKHQTSDWIFGKFKNNKHN